MGSKTGQVKVFNYVTVPNASTYQSIMDVFLDARQRYVIELRPSEVYDELKRRRGDDLKPFQEIAYHLEQLVRWGNLARSHDTSAVSRISDFYRRQRIFHLTSAGEVAHQALREVKIKLGGVGSLQTAMLISLRDALRNLVESVKEPEPQPKKLLLHLHELHNAFDPLTSEATRFMGELSRHVSAKGVEEERFVFYKQAVLAYVSRFVEELRGTSGDIAGDLRELREEDLPKMFEIAANVADLPPTIDGSDPRGSWIDDQLLRWEGVCAWFIGDSAGGAEPIVERLSDVAVGAVVELTRSLGRLNDQRGRSVDRAADFRTLARWFSASPSDEDAQEIFQAAFGLYGSRNLYLEEEDQELTSPKTSWWDAPPAPIPVRLRTAGDQRRSGGPSRVADHSDAKEWMAQIRRRERLRHQAALGMFVGQGQRRLSDLKELEQEELEVFLSLIDEALTIAPDSDGARAAQTADGGLEVLLKPQRAGDLSFVTITTPQGRIHCQNYLIDVINRRPEKTKSFQPPEPTHEEAA